MTFTTDQFIHDLNVKSYSVQLLATRDESRRGMLVRLLAGEIAHARHMGWRRPPASSGVPPTPRPQLRREGPADRE